MSIYHLHIPRTGGVFVREKIIKQLDNVFSGHRDRLPSSFSGYDHVSGHFATTPIKDTDRNFAIVREPISLTFSYINYMRDVFYPSWSFDDLFYFYQETNKIQNFVNINTKFLTGTIDSDLYNNQISDLKTVAEDAWYVGGYALEPDIAIDVIANNKTDVIFFEDRDRNNIVCNIYGVKAENRKLNSSSDITPDVFSRHYRTIKDLNELDIATYLKLKEAS
jgi:hypothetical protein